MEPIKLTEEELEKLVELQRKSSMMTQEFGNLEIMKLQVHTLIMLQAHHMPYLHLMR